jgi:hypothetical protein
VAGLYQFRLKLFDGAFACQEQGISSFSFMVMSRATAPLGVIYLLFFGPRASSFWRTSIMALQTVLCLVVMADCSLWFILLHTAVGIALLTAPNFETSWRVTKGVTFDAAGLGPFNPNSTDIVTRMTFGEKIL